MKTLSYPLFLFFFLSVTSLIQAQDSTFVDGWVGGGEGEYVEIYISDGINIETAYSDGTGEVSMYLDLSYFESENLEVYLIDCNGVLVNGFFDFVENSDGEIVYLFFEIEYCEETFWIYGCTDVTANNYDPNATIDDGTCQYGDGAENDLCADAIPLVEGINFIDNSNAFLNEGMDGDCWGFGSGEAEQTSVWYSFTTPETPVAVYIESMGDGTNTLTDTQFGLYLACGEDMIECDGNSGSGLFAMFEFECGYLEPNTDYILQIDGWAADSGTCNVEFSMDSCELVGGCTDCEANNYNPSAEYDDGSCNYDELTCEDGTLVFATLITGSWAYEISVSIDGQLINFLPCGDFQLENNSTYTAEICVPDGCLLVELYDSFGDGWNGGFLTLDGDGIFLVAELAYGSYGVNILPVNDEACESLNGCTFESACNYNPEALLEDGSCTYPGCTDELANNYNELAGCDDGSCFYPCSDGQVQAQLYVCTYSNAQNVAIEIIDEGGEVIFANDNFNTNQILYFDLCFDFDGCYTVNMSNTDGLGWYGGYYGITVDGAQVSTDYLDYDLSEESVDFSFDGTCGPVYGCTNEAACNFNPDATDENWSCVFPGCMDIEALNYNPYAGCDDEGSCFYPDDCGDDQQVAMISGYSYSEDGTFEITNENGDVLYYNDDINYYTEFFDYACFDTEGCMTVTMTGTSSTWEGDSSFVDLNFWIYSNDVIVASGWEYGEDGILVVEFSLDGTCGPIMGCTDPNACNFNEEATQEDYTCSYPGCTDPEALNYSYWAGCDDDSCEYPCGDDQVQALLYVCTFSNGQNVGIEILDEEGNSVFYGEDFGNGQIVYFDLCMDPVGCYTVNMWNSAGETGWYNGYYWINVDGITVSTDYLDYNLTEESVIFSFDGSCGPVNGCIDETACNYNPDANVNDWTCTYPGCMDEEALNYSPSWGCEDNSLCIYPPACGDDQSLAVITAYSYGTTSSIQITNEEGDVLFFENDFSQYEIYEYLCLDNVGCLTVTMTTSASDSIGFSDFGYWIYVDGDYIAGNYFYTESEDVITTQFSLDGTCGPIIGCTNPDACNYNEDADTEDWSCTYPGCMIEGALNYDPYAGCNDESLCEYPEPCEANEIIFITTTDAYGSEISWNIYPLGSTIPVASGSGFESYSTNTQVSCLEDGCYTLDMFDSFGDGWDLGADGGITVLSDGNVLFEGGLSDGSYASINFGINSSCSDSTDVYGCTDSEAFNYNPLATLDDGSCLYLEDVYGCTDSLAINFNPFATIDDGSCVYDEEVDCTSLFGIFDILEDEDVIIVVNLSEGDDLNFFWDFGDGSTSTDAFPVHYYEEDGTYLVCLTISNSDSTCSDTFCADIVYESSEFNLGGEDGEDLSSEDNGFTINIMSEEDALSLDVKDPVLESLEIQLYPNPTDEMINLNWNTISNRTLLKVYDLSGRVVLEETVLGNSSQININHLSSGMYLLQMTTDGSNQSLRFEIQK